MGQARRGRPSERLVISPSERATLERWTRRRSTAQGLAQRARIVLACSTGRHDTEVGRELRLTRQTIGRWRRSFQQHRVDGLLDEPRPGAPRRITDAMIERVITDTLETTPATRRHWNARAMAKTAGLSQSAVARIWKASCAAAPPRRDVQALEGPALHRQGARYRRPVSGATGSRLDLVCR